MNLRIRLFVLAIAAIGLNLSATGAYAQQAQTQPPPPAPAAPSLREQLTEAITILQQQVATEQDRVQTITDKLKATDEQIERRIDRILNYLVTVTDSVDSNTKIVRAKQDILTALQQNVAMYVRERDARVGALSRQGTRIPKADLMGDITALDRRILKRIDQSLAIINSMPMRKDTPRYNNTISYDGWATTSQVNPEYQQNYLASGRANVIRDNAVQALNKGIQKLKMSDNALKANMQFFATGDDAKYFEQVISSNNKAIQKINDDLFKLSTVQAPNTHQLSGSSADMFLQQVSSERQNNKTDMAEWIRLKNDRDVERARLAELQANLAYRQRQLQSLGQ